MISRRLMKYGLAAGAGTGFVTALYYNRWDVTSLGIVRFGRAAFTVAQVATDYKWTLRNQLHGTAKYTELRSEVHKRSAEKLLKLCCINGGVFIKVGQHVGAMDYLLPSEYVLTLRVLHSHAPKSPVDDVKQVLREDFGKEPSEIFATFDDEPTGAASLAQVHKATLHDGQVVAVKVQHRHVLGHSLVDMKTMEILVHLVALLFPEFSFLWLAEETKKNLPKELDFANEGLNAENVKVMFSYLPWLKIPKILWELTTKRVLTMEFCEGCEVTDVEALKRNNIPVAQVAKKLGQLYSEMIFVQGYVHCDPHPGNILVQKADGNPKIVLLDHGLYTMLTDKFRMDYSRLWMSVINTDLTGMRESATALGVRELYGLLICMLTARSWSSVTQGLDKQKHLTPSEKATIKAYVADHIPQISEILNKVPREMLLILKTNDLLRSIETVLGIRGAGNSLMTMAQCCAKAVANEKMKFCDGWMCRMGVTISYRFVVAKITILQFFMWFQNTFFGSCLRRLRIIS